MLPTCKVWLHLTKRFQRSRFLKTQPIRIKNSPWRPCFLSDRDEMNKLYKGPYINVPAKVGSIWHSSFRGEDLKFKKLTDGWQRRRRTLHGGKSSHDPSGQVSQKVGPENSSERRLRIRVAYQLNIFIPKTAIFPQMLNFCSWDNVSTMKYIVFIRKTILLALFGTIFVYILGWVANFEVSKSK